MINLKNPYPRENPSAFRDVEYPITQRQYLDVPDQQPSADFFDVVNRRRSSRTFFELPLESLNTLLWNSSRTIERNPGTSTRWEHRPCPSAGGLHPIDLFVVRSDRPFFELAVYEPTRHALATISADSTSVGDFYSSVNAVLPVGNGTLLWLGAQFERTLSKYVHGESLVWRDAGSLLATLSFVAEALDLNSCSLGVDGSEALSKCLRTNAVTGVGGLVVGSRQS